MEQEINLDEITDMNLLQNLLDQTEDIDDRKAIRGRIQELRSIERAKRDEILTRLTNTREDMLQERQRKAVEHKQRTLAMYDNMAKSAPAGGKKKMDIGILSTGQITPPSTPTGRDNEPQDVLLECQAAAETRKKKILAAYEAAARSAPAGATKSVDMEQFIKADVSNYHPVTKGDSGSTFQMSGGVPKMSRGSAPGTPISPGFPGGLVVFPKSSEKERADPGQDFIRARQREAEDSKRRLLAGYDYISKQGAGPKTVVLEELRRIDIA